MVSIPKLVLEQTIRCTISMAYYNCAVTLLQVVFMSCSAFAMATMNASVDVSGEEYLDSIPNLTRPGAARSAKLSE